MSYIAWELQALKDAGRLGPGPVPTPDVPTPPTLNPFPTYAETIIGNTNFEVQDPSDPRGTNTSTGFQFLLDNMRAQIDAALAFPETAYQQEQIDIQLWRYDYYEARPAQVQGIIESQFRPISPIAAISDALVQQAEFYYLAELYYNLIGEQDRRDILETAERTEGEFTEIDVADFVKGRDDARKKLSLRLDHFMYAYFVATVLSAIPMTGTLYNGLPVPWDQPRQPTARQPRTRFKPGFAANDPRFTRDLLPRVRTPGAMQPAITALMFLVQEGITSIPGFWIDDTGVPHIQVDFDPIPEVPEIALPVKTVSTPTGKAQVTVGKDRFTIRETPTYGGLKTPNIRPRISPSFRPYTGTTSLGRGMDVVIHSTTPATLENIPDMTLEIALTAQAGVSISQKMRPDRPKRPPEENTLRRDKKSVSQRQYMAAAAMAGKALNTPFEVLDWIHAVRAGVKIRIGGIWYPLDQLTTLHTVGLLSSDKFYEYVDSDDIYVDYEQIAMNILLMKAVDRSISTLKQYEKDFIRNSNFFQNTYGNPSTWLSRFKRGYF